MLEAVQIKKKLQSALSNKRYIHTLGVAEEAVRLAEVYFEDAEKAEISGLLHDCAKDIPDKLKLSLCHEFHIKVNKAMRENPDLAHSFLGAEIAAREYGVDDSDILNAIKYHTTGRCGMSNLEKIIYLADYIEPNRKPFSALEQIRKLSYSDLNEAMAFSLAHSVKYVENKGLRLHELTAEALNYYK